MNSQFIASLFILGVLACLASQASAANTFPATVQGDWKGTCRTDVANGLKLARAIDLSIAASGFTALANVYLGTKCVGTPTLTVTADGTVSSIVTQSNETQVDFSFTRLVTVPSVLLIDTIVSYGGCKLNASVSNDVLLNGCNTLLAGTTQCPTRHGIFVQGSDKNKLAFSSVFVIFDAGAGCYTYNRTRDVDLIENQYCKPDRCDTSQPATDTSAATAVHVHPVLVLLFSVLFALAFVRNIAH